MIRIILILCIGVAYSRAFSIKRSFCGNDGVLTQNNGVISSHTGMSQGHTYGRNMNCLWKIQAPDGMKVELVAQSFDLEDSTACDYDYLELFDGPDTTYSSLGKFCGTNFRPITSTGRYLTLRFITDDDTQAGGFQIFYNFTTVDIHSCSASQFQCANGRCIANSYRCDNADDCGDDSDEKNCAGVTTPAGGCASGEFACGDLAHTCVPRTWLCDGDDDCGNGVDEIPSNCIKPSDSRCGALNQTGTSGSVSSPNYPNGYGSNIHCVFFLQAPTGTKTLSFGFDDNFHIEPDISCDYDYVSVYSDNKSFKHGPFCGNQNPGTFTMPGDHAYVEFVSDDSDEYAGFRLNWKALQTQSAAVKRFLFNTTNSNNNITVTTPPSSSSPIPQKCHQAIHVLGTGQILSPNYGRCSYPPKQYCTWELVAPIGQVIQLQFADFSLQTSRSCTRDSVRIFDGLEAFDGLLGKFCGQVIPPDIESSGNKMLIFFHSDSGVEDKGFNITYTNKTTQVTIDIFQDNGCHGRTKLFNSTRGFISSPGYDGHLAYDNDIFCSWLIQAPVGKVITLKFEDFLTEKSPGCDYDYLAVYDGSNNSTNKLAQLCGLQFPADISSSGRFMYLQFNADPDVAGRGFNLTYEVSYQKAPCDMFRCGEGSCVFNQMVCNNVKECPDGADELICDNGHCGRPAIPPVVVSQKIVGGREAIPHSWPWMVSLRANGVHQCGAALISNQWILTAGHCFEANRHTPEWTAAAGKHLEIKTEDTVQVRQVVRIVVFPKYNYLTTDNDISLVKVDRPFTFNTNVSAVCLPETGPQPGDDGYVTGWGAVETSCCPGVLKQVMLPVLANSVCRQPAYLGDQVTDNMFCAGYDDGGRDACQGDSGGPFVVERSGVWHIQGITSFGSGCADAMSPGVYTRVHNYVQWIRQTVAQNM